MSSADKRIATDATLQLLVAAIQALEPGLVTTSQAGKLAPDAEAIENGFIKLATSLNKGLMSKAFAALLEDPSKIIYYNNAATRSAAYHNSMPPRGKNLGSSITSAQLAAISGRTYDDLWLGDYWVINGHTHTIVSFEPYWNVGDTAMQRGHIGVVSDGGWSSAWYSSNDTSKGYVSRSEAIRDLIRDSLAENEWKNDEEWMVGTIVMVYEARAHNVPDFLLHGHIFRCQHIFTLRYLSLFSFYNSFRLLSIAKGLYIYCEN